MADPVLTPWLAGDAETDGRYAYNQFQGDGLHVNFGINFQGKAPGYLNRSDVKWYTTTNAISTAVQVVDPSAWQSDTVIHLVDGSGNAFALGTTISIFRDTAKDEPLNDFSDGSVMDEENLDTNFEQAIYAVAEMVDRFDVSNDTSAQAVAIAQAAADDAATAITTANGAVTTANSATSTAGAAVASADAANVTAASAVTLANTAIDNAADATTAANAAVATANAIDAKAQSALDTANGIDAKATSALSTANAASATAGSAVTTANGAVTTANAAVTTANAAAATANAIDAKAQDALDTANEALAATTGAFTTDVSIVKTNPLLTLDDSSGTGSTAVYGREGGIIRWGMRMAAADWRLNRYDATGVLQGAAVTVASNGNTSFSGSVTALGAVSSGSSIIANGSAGTLLVMNDTSGANYGDVRWLDGSAHRAWSLRGNTAGAFTLNRFPVGSDTVADSPISVSRTDGSITLNGTALHGVGTPSAGGDATNKTYVDAQAGVALVASGSLTGVTVLDLRFPAGYTHYELILDGVSGATATIESMIFQWAQAGVALGGATPYATYFNYQVLSSNVMSASSSSTNGSGTLFGGLSNVAGVALSSTISIDNPRDGTKRRTMRSVFIGSQDGARVHGTWANETVSTAVCDGLLLFLASQNAIARGTYRLYGKK